MSPQKTGQLTVASHAALGLILNVVAAACLPAFAQRGIVSIASAVPAPPITVAIQPQFVLADGTAIKLRICRTISSADSHVGDLLDFEVIRDVLVGKSVVIPRGSIARGKINEVQHKRRMGRGGKLNIQLDSVQLINGNEVKLRSVKRVKGGGHTKAMTVAMGVTAVAFYPAAPLFLLVHGQESTILKGTEVTAYIEGDFPVEPKKVMSAMPAAPRVTKAKAEVVKTELAAKQASFDEILGLLPRRVIDSQGNEGDMVNLVFVASEARLGETMRLGGWMETVHSTRQVVWHAATKPKNNVTMPMSNLFLYGRSQDFGYAMEDSASHISRRHHLRIWKTDSEIDGNPVWAAAATHDIGFEKDKSKWAVTHKIDPDVDGERDFIGSSLVGTHLVTQLTYITPSGPVFEARTATGGKYHSDGRILLLTLQ